MQPSTASQLIEFKLQLGPRPQHTPGQKSKIDIENVSFWYGAKLAIKDVSLQIFDREVTAFIGPSGCGKTTLLRCFNRTHDEIRGARMSGRIRLDGEDIYGDDVDPPLLRRRFGWVAQKPNPFPASIYRNISYGPLLHGLVAGRAATDTLVERCLRLAGLWDEVKDRLTANGMDLSVGQQQRLCVARAIATNPEVLLMDEPASALDPISTARLEEQIERLAEHYAIVIITHNMQQAARVSQRIAVFHSGELVEIGDAAEIFVSPRHPATRGYLAGRFG